MPDVLMLTLHPLPESPPTGDMERWICFGDDKGNSDFDVAYTVLPDENGHSEYTWWAERPVLPAPGDRLTTEHIERVLYEAERLRARVPDPDDLLEVLEMAQPLSDADIESVRRVRATLPTTECPPWHYLSGPYQDDPERTECPHRNTHAEQRRVYEAMATTTKGEDNAH